MKKNVQQEVVKFQIKGIELLDLNIIYPKTPLIGEVVFKFNINVEIKTVNENSLAMAIVSVDILDNKTADKYGFVKVNCIYGIDDFISFVDAETKKVDLPKQFVTALNSISLSTTRGIMYDQFRGTFLHGAILPILDPTFLEKNTK
jgi:hypothetical protein